MSKSTEHLLSSKPFALAKGIYGRFIRNSKDRIELAVIVDDDTRAEDLRKAWGAIDRVRAAVRDYQGSDFRRLGNALMLGKASMKLVEGFSYTEIAMDINYDCLVNLCIAVEKIDSGVWEDGKENLIAASLLLKIMRMKDKDIHAWLTAGLDDIREGRAPWSLENGPVSKQRVRDALRQLENKLIIGDLVIRNLPQPDGYFPLSKLVEKNKKAWDKAQELLKQFDNSGGLHRLREAHTRRSSQGVENSG